MSLFDQLALHAAGVAGKYQQGRNDAAQERYKRDITAQSRQDELERQALQQAILQKREERAAMEDAARSRYYDSQVEENKARAHSLLNPKPVAEPKPTPKKYRYEADKAGKMWAIDEETNEAQPVKGFPGQRVPGTGGGGPTEPKPKQIPSSGVKGIVDWKILGDATDRAVEAFADPKISATGFVQGRVAGLAGQLGLADPKAISARSKLANIGTALGKLRSGGAITPSEFERLAPLIPNANDDEDTVRQKLADLKAYLDSVSERTTQTYEETGYDVRGLRGGATPGASSHHPDNPFVKRP